MLLNLRQMPVGMETHDVQPFPVIHGPIPDHDPLSPLYVVLELWNMSQSIEHTRFSMVSVPYCGLAHTIPELWAVKIWHQISGKRVSHAALPNTIYTHRYIGLLFFFFILQKSSMSKVVKPCYSARIWMRYLELEASYRLDLNSKSVSNCRENPMESTISSYDSKLFFVKVKNRHSHASRQTLWVLWTTDIILRVFDVRLSCEACLGVDVLLHHAPSPEQLWLSMLMNIGEEDIEIALAFFSCFIKRLVTLFSALWYILHLS